MTSVDARNSILLALTLMVATIVSAEDQFEQANTPGIYLPNPYFGLVDSSGQQVPYYDLRIEGIIENLKRKLYENVRKLANELCDAGKLRPEEISVSVSVPFFSLTAMYDMDTLCDSKKEDSASLDFDAFNHLFDNPRGGIP